MPSRLHLHIFVVSSSYSSTSIPRRRLDQLLNATWYKKSGIVLRLAVEIKRLPSSSSCLTLGEIRFSPETFVSACNSRKGPQALRQSLPQSLLKLLWYCR